MISKQCVSGAALAVAVALTGGAMAEGTGNKAPEPSGSSAAGDTSAQSDTQGGAQQGASTQKETRSDSRLSLAQRKQLQRELQSRGHYQGNIDGIVGPMTREAVIAFQRKQGLSADGELDTETIESLGMSPERQPVSGSDEPQRQPMSGSDTSRGMERSDEQASVELASLNETQARELQTKLQELGFYRGEVDGVAGPMTRTALQQYFRAQAQLAARGMLDENVMSALVESDDTSGTRPSQGTQGSTGSQGGTMPQGSQQPAQGTQPAPETSPR
jgi:peptidoglycan hydrolase-like protein with peptidoglycan-binding domain